MCGTPSEVVDFALDSEFRLTRTPDDRGEAVRILFFARPSLRRRGYDIGLEALRILKEQRAGVEISLFGSLVEDLGPIPFEHRALGVLDSAAVAEALNASHILLTLSLTNISNVPFEGMACGCAVVDVDLPNVSTMVTPGTCFLADLNPEALAGAMRSLVDQPALRDTIAQAGARAVHGRTWERTGRMFEEALLRMCFSRLTRPMRSRELGEVRG